MKVRISYDPSTEKDAAAALEGTLRERFAFVRIHQGKADGSSVLLHLTGKRPVLPTD